ncbi:transglutaminase-like superfamily protein [Oleiphilus messinensis]|uniref:Transglutaminase-like superfamily protein n=1 Tax=Oleiphilus messinensis TaxID=141451 RepID=A0A1Y0I6Q3_9GAMM|nr:transglutaminase-like domain-containing protein [Oleiphilus messinensis]ARU56172.1 transglutaminase-like superfamily protein [Oleiphilus messinensis]
MKHFLFSIKGILLLNIVALVGIAIYGVTLVYPPEEATRLRNALIFETASKPDFVWPQGQYPAQFRAESIAPPDDFSQFVSELPIQPHMSGFVKVLLAGERLLERERHGGAIQSNTVDTLNKMQSEGIGYCSDYTQVINGIAYTLGVPVREWGMSFHGYSGDGHAFSEIYDSDFGKWVFLDVHSGFYAVRMDTLEPLSFLEYRALILSDPAQIKIVRINDERFAFKTDQAVKDYYARGAHEVFLYWSNDVFSYDASPWVRASGAVSRYLEQLTAILIGVHPRIHLYPDPVNQEAQEALAKLKQDVLILFFAGIVLVVSFMGLLIFQIKQNGARKSLT